MSQGKLCQVIEGEVQDVAVDLRVGSPTYGQAYSAILSGEIHNQIWIPVGFAHGFAVLSESAIFHYKCTTAYSKSSERTLLFNDPVLQIDWLVRNPILSEKDLQGVPLAGLPIDFYFYEAGG
jgi:dTDP-4-dehydrorhamnose 3,5-epimerase